MTLEVVLNITDTDTDNAQDMIRTLKGALNNKFTNYDIDDYTVLEEPIVEDDDEEDDPED